VKTYLVGGAVRDRLLELPVKEHDWVVVGATPEEMKAQGFRQVGRDFPVFLHPETHEEYALARTERKTGPGYHGFECHADPGVTLEEDLQRRDLTINALAEDEHGNIIDYYGGRQDLQDRVLRHISKHFAEDPVRILRVARFAARFDALGFRVADETLELMQRMVDNGEVDALVPERVWQELYKALGEDRPSAFFETLRACGALKQLFPEIDRLWGVPQPEQWHPEIDTGVHTMMVLDAAARISDKPGVRFAALTHDLGKGTTPKEEWPRHIAHEARSENLVANLCNRLKAPRDVAELARIVAKYHGDCHKAFELRSGTILKLLHSLDAYRRPERFEDFLIACEADHLGRTGYEQEPYPQADFLRQALSVSRDIDVNKLRAQGLEGQALGEAIERQRLSNIEALGKERG
jgi:tRNA nucleotidyltransferase (CCA-adding enzyme)